MNAYLLDDIAMLRAHLASKRQLFEPQRQGESGDLVWLPMTDASAATAAMDKPLLSLSSPKSFFFTEREPLFRFENGAFIESLPEIEPRVLFGVRSCDLCAIAYQDRFFQEDPYYQARRRATLLVGMDCTLPCEGGFCPSVDAGPFVRDGQADLVCHRLAAEEGAGWLIVVASTQGEEALQELALKAAPDDFYARRAARETAVAAQFPEAGYIRAGIERINRGEVAAESWEAMGLQCLSCSGCTSLCPTCSCFATFEHPVADEQAMGFERERCWDSCLYEAFQREAGGHNPSRTAGQRVERFWFHKFSDAYMEDFGRYGCVGCGRCERTCPGVIGVHSVMKKIVSAS